MTSAASSRRTRSSSAPAIPPLGFGGTPRNRACRTNGIILPADTSDGCEPEKSDMKELIFLVEKAREGGYTARGSSAQNRIDFRLR
jgi:hypothetical protein